MPVGRNFQHTITLKLNNLELEKNSLELAIRQLSADIANLKDLATGPITEQIEYVIERDPLMITLATQLVSQETLLRGRLTKFGENHRDVRRISEQIEEIRKRRELRKAEIGEQTRRCRKGSSSWNNCERKPKPRKKSLIKPVFSMNSG